MKNEFMRTERIMVRFTKKHFDLVKREAKKKGLYSSQWIRAIVLKELNERDSHDEV